MEEPWQSMDDQLNDYSRLVRMLLGLLFLLVALVPRGRRFYGPTHVLDVRAEPPLV